MRFRIRLRAEMTATVNGIRLSYSDVGQGIPLVCLHGGMGCGYRLPYVPAFWIWRSSAFA